MALTFIGKVADDLLKRFGSNCANLTVVFPNRRAGVFFKEALTSKLEQPVWAPEITTIRDFIVDQSPYEVPDQLTLLFEMYETYRSLGADEAFEHFYPWGQMLLRDFDEIDKYLVDGEQVFGNLAEIKAIEGQFALDEEQLKALDQFWQAYANQPEYAMKQKFSGIWEMNRAVYSGFRERLAGKGWGYEGMAYRKVAEELESGVKGFEGRQFVFAGFNALSRAEQTLIKTLWGHGLAEVYWDVDRYYLDDKTQEAGRFLRANFQYGLPQPSDEWIANELAYSDKKVKTYGVPLRAGQAKAMGEILKKQVEAIDPDQTAVVLPDENQLFPVLYSLPEPLKSVNVTMGYPLRNTPFYSLLEGLVKLQQDAGGDSARKRYYFRDVMTVLAHPYIHYVDREAVNKKRQAFLKQNRIFLPAEELQELGDSEEARAGFATLFQPLHQVNEVFPYFQGVLNLVRKQLEAGDFQYPQVEMEYLYHFECQLVRIQDALSQYELQLPLEAFWQLFRQIISSTSLPFTGEPLEGLQVMGMLETRNLDFEQLFVLSMNEGQFPGGSDQQSFIPFNLRKSFGLPTHEDNEALYAYHFYRLLQRANQVYLFYDTEVSGLSKGEKSRFILQLEHEWQQTNPNLHYRNFLVNAPLTHDPEKPIEIPKSGDVWEKLERYLVEKQDKPATFSPSAVITYITCPLQFYFRYIAGLEEEEEVNEEISPDVLGSIFHDAIAGIYREYREEQGDEVTSDSLPVLEEKIAPHLAHALREHFSQELQDLQGRNLLIKEIIEHQLRSVLKRDQKSTPFKLHLLEEGDYAVDCPVNVNGTKAHVRLKGYIDRMDEVDQTKRILDYKTGTIQRKSRPAPEAMMEDAGHKMFLQLAWYGYLYLKHHPEESVLLGIYPVKQISQDIQYLDKAPFTLEALQPFEDALTGKFESLFDPEVPFQQTDDPKACAQCPYNTICHREEQS